MRTNTGHITTDDGIRLFYESVGTGHALLLVPNGPPWINDFTRFARNRTIVFYDARNRGQSDYITDAAKLARGIAHDVDDMEAVRQHFGVDRVDLLGHSYLGLAVILYAMKYGDHVNRVIQIGATPPDAAKSYPPALNGADDLLRDVLAKLGALSENPAPADPVQRCRAFWSVLRPIYVVNPADVEKLDGWQRCHLQTERTAAAYFTEHLLPSIRPVTASEVSRVTAQVLTVHGTKDRSSPYGGGRDWAAMLPNGRLLTVDNAGHMPWIEKPGDVFDAVQTFLDGSWPIAAVHPR
jgi:pimeloyl-ACP methyl ester carboxylesterase